MIDRRLVRIRVFLDLYSFLLSNQGSENQKIENLKDKLKFSLNSLNTLYYFFLFLIVSTFNNVDSYSLKSKLKFNKSDHSNLLERMAANKVVMYLDKVFFKKIKFDLSKKEDISHIVDDIFRDILKNYSNDLLEKSSSDLEGDASFLLLLFKKYFLGSEKLFIYLNDNNIYCDTDLEYVIKHVKKSISNFPNNKSFDFKYVNQKDSEFGLNLINSYGCLNNKNQDIIKKYSNNWDVNRIALLDMILIKLALSEIFDFKEIPYKVSINEYIEISKQFSTKKSHGFINGILDKVVHDFKIND